MKNKTNGSKVGFVEAQQKKGFVSKAVKFTAIHRKNMLKKFVFHMV